MFYYRTGILLLPYLHSLTAFVPKRAASRPNDAEKSLLQQTIQQSNDVQRDEVLRSSIFGDLYRIRMHGDDELDSDYLGAIAAMEVPTFASTLDGEVLTNLESWKTSLPTKARSIEGVINQGPAFILDNVIPRHICQEMIRACDQLGFRKYNNGKNNHGAMQILATPELADAVAKKLSIHIDVSEVEARRQEMMDGSGAQSTEEEVRLVFAGLNRRWRIYRYDACGNETFSPHIDAGFPPSGLSEDGNSLIWDSSDHNAEEVVSRLTVLMYLNDDFVGGETSFFRPASSSSSSKPREDQLALIAAVKPVAGSCLVFPQGVGEGGVDYAREHWPLHEGSAVISGSPKYVIRSDVLFASQRELIPLDDAEFRYDHVVRQAFLPRSPSMNRNFMSHLSSLYNPHMGVENLGPLLYAFIRFTKKRRIVEIGAGYTSLWILQALKDNDDEFERIRKLQRDGQNRLLDIEWTIPPIVEEFDRDPPSLLCIDNCLHQKETATGALAVAKALGLDNYIELLVGDAYELELTTNTVDLLWCDFGVGSRMRDFIKRAWSCLRPGGFLLCHSTLTNLNTREWLEAARARKGEEIVGIPPDEYVEISLLEPQKRFQNSVSVFQKRKSSDGNPYQEPVYSQYA